MRTNNPALSNAFTGQVARDASDRMTVPGTINRTGLLLLIAATTALFAWNQSVQTDGGYGDQPVFVPTAWLWIGMVGGLVTALATIFKKTWAPVSAPLYAAFEGLLLGALSGSFEVRFPGIVFQAMTGTFGTLGALLFAYRTGLIRATERFKLGVAAATGGIAIIYLVGLVMNLFGSHIPYIHESGGIGIGFSLLVVSVAALNLILDFDFIETGARGRAPKYMEWYSAFSLMVTLVWLYMEMLRLISKVRSRD
jgi:uncharacterized YccA/Bax inhibitor family protein